MKLLVLSLSLFISHATHAQEYQFDLLTQYATTYSGSTQHRTLYASTKDTSYVLMIGSFLDDSEARLIDYRTKRIHMFKAKILKKEHGGRYELKYRKTYKLETPRIYDKYDFTVENSKTDSITSELKLRLFINEGKSKKILSTEILTVVKSEVDFFKLFRIACMHPFEMLDRLTLPGNVMVISSTGLGSNGVKSESKITEIKSESLTLIVPTK